MQENILTLSVASVAEVKARMKAVVRGQHDTSPRFTFTFTFTNGEDLLRTINANRWSLLQALAGAGPLGVRELARRVGRDVKGVHTDAQVLVDCGLLEKAATGALHFPYDAVRVEFATQGKAAQRLPGVVATNS